jgi:uncharacterized membrane protein
MPFKRLLPLLLLLGFLVSFIQLGLISITFEKLGLSASSAVLLLITTLFGSQINVPIFRLSGPWMPTHLPPQVRWVFRFERPPIVPYTIVAVNLGGCVVPVAFSVFLLAHAAISLAEVILAVALVASISYIFSRPLAGTGIVMPVFIAPLTAAAAAIALDPENRAVLAYVGGTLGVLIGADLLRINDIRKLGAPVASIGGGGSFDGIFLAGIIAVLLA